MNCLEILSFWFVLKKHKKCLFRVNKRKLNFFTRHFEKYVCVKHHLEALLPLDWCFFLKTQYKITFVVPNWNGWKNQAKKGKLRKYNYFFDTLLKIEHAEILNSSIIIAISKTFSHHLHITRSLIRWVLMKMKCCCLQQELPRKAYCWWSEIII